METDNVCNLKSYDYVEQIKIEQLTKIYVTCVRESRKFILY